MTNKQKIMYNKLTRKEKRIFNSVMDNFSATSFESA
jgi:hypothetical protein